MAPPRRSARAVGATAAEPARPATQPDEEPGVAGEEAAAGAADAVAPAPAPAQPPQHETADSDDGDGDDDDGMGTSSSSSDDDDDEADVPDVSDADAAELERLEGELEADPASWEGLTGLIALTRRCGLKARCAAAREAARVAHPLAPHLWVDWLEDEAAAYEAALAAAGGDARAAGPSAARARWEGLATAATADFLDTALWLTRLRFTLAHDPDVATFTPAGLAKARALAGDALAAGGLVPNPGGAALWEVVLGYEAAALAAGAGGEAQADRVRGMWHRRLRTPLADGEAALAAYEAWERSTPSPHLPLPAHLAADAAAARSAGAARAALETALVTARARDGGAPGPDLLASHAAAIKAEQSAGADPPRVQVAFERAVADFPLTSALWARYGRYVEAALPASPAVAAAVWDRAVRNCPWAGGLWACAARCAERRAGGRDERGEATPPTDPAALAEVDALAARALAIGLASAEDTVEVVLARADAHRRCAAAAAATNAPTAPAARAALAAAFEVGEAALVAFSSPHPWRDPGVRLPAYWAACELALGGPAAAVAAWEAALKGGPGSVLPRQAAAYVAAGTSLAAAGALDAARSIFKRGLARKLDDGLKAGPPADAAATAGGAALAAAWLKVEREHGSAASHLAACGRAEPVLEAAAGVVMAQDAVIAAPPTNRAAKRKAVNEGGGSGGGGGAKRQAREAAVVPAAPAAPAPAGDAPPARAHLPPAYTDVHTLFVRGLPPAMDADGLAALFAEATPGHPPPRARVPPPRDGNASVPSPGNRGIGYVQFASEAALAEGLRLDGAALEGGHTLSVAKSRPPGVPGGAGPPGGFGAGRGRGGGGGRGRGGGRFSSSDAAFQPGGRGGPGHRRALDVSGSGPRPPLPGQGNLLVPRSLVPRAAAAAVDRSGPPKSNADFRAMLFGGGGGGGKKEEEDGCGGGGEA